MREASNDGMASVAVHVVNEQRSGIAVIASTDLIRRRRTLRFRRTERLNVSHRADRLLLQSTQPVTRTRICRVSSQRTALSLSTSLPSFRKVSALTDDRSMILAAVVQCKNCTSRRVTHKRAFDRFNLFAAL